MEGLTAATGLQQWHPGISGRQMLPQEQCCPADALKKVPPGHPIPPCPGYLPQGQAEMTSRQFLPADRQGPYPYQNNVNTVAPVAMSYTVPSGVAAMLPDMTTALPGMELATRDGVSCGWEPELLFPLRPPPLPWGLLAGPPERPPCPGLPEDRKPSCAPCRAVPAFPEAPLRAAVMDAISFPRAEKSKEPVRKPAAAIVADTVTRVIAAVVATVIRRFLASCRAVPAEPRNPPEGFPEGSAAEGSFLPSFLI